jgi:hypothetical protein
MATLTKEVKKFATDKKLEIENLKQRSKNQNSSEESESE